MNDHDTDVLDTLRGSLDAVTMGTPVDDIVSTGRARRNRRRLATVAAGTVAVAGVALGVASLANPPAGPPATAPGANAAGEVHVRTVAYTVDSRADGTVQVTWTKQQWFEDPAGLEAALRQAGFPVVVKVGEFCAGPGDDLTLVRGSGPGVRDVVRPLPGADATFVFDASALPPGKQLFMGYLNPAQLEVTGGSPGVVERLVPIDTPLTCTTVAPPREGPRAGSEEIPSAKPAKPTK
ncbi:hypothetical protein AB0J72_13360 [Dactylosporangium sp. NPDC049742]|uniref:hypothetical protein n=1 Tax=Dactylosporangium sp. NPDC049742 TaxID=3154737 RepID=UPI00344477DE